jgi:defect-in-organelle-trafficking protein DotC
MNMCNNLGRIKLNVSGNHIRRDNSCCIFSRSSLLFHGATNRAFCGVLLLFVSLSSYADVVARTPAPLFELEEMASRDGSRHVLSAENGLGLRLQAVKELAETLGVQRAIQYRYEAINRVLESNSFKLDKIFDFKPLLSSGDRLLPPVINEANDVFNLRDATFAEASQATYEIKSEARIVSTAPTWRDYLIQHFAVNEINYSSLHPKNTEEKAVWLSGVRDGWAIGSKQADQIFSANIARLVRDYRGIIRFHLLEAQGVVSMPVLAEGDMGIRVNGKMLDVGQKIFRITDTVHFRPENKWNPYSDIRNYPNIDSLPSTQPPKY